MLTAVNSWWQLSKADKSENLPRELNFQFLFNKWEEVNSYSVKPVLAELGKKTQLIWVELSLAWSGFQNILVIDQNKQYTSFIN